MADVARWTLDGIDRIHGESNFLADLQLRDIDEDGNDLGAVDLRAWTSFEAQLRRQPGAVLIATATVTSLQVQASVTLVYSGNVAAGDSVTIGTRTYIYRVAPALADEVLIGANSSESSSNLVAAINLTGTPGTTYGALTTINADVTATLLGNGFRVTAKSAGDEGNAIPVAEVSAAMAWSENQTFGGVNGGVLRYFIDSQQLDNSIVPDLTRDFEVQVTTDIMGILPSGRPQALVKGVGTFEASTTEETP